eukprot:3075192-Rhodomonas_salina.1
MAALHPLMHCTSFNRSTAVINGSTAPSNGKTAFINGSTASINGSAAVINGSTPQAKARLTQPVAAWQHGAGTPCMLVRYTVYARARAPSTMSGTDAAYGATRTYYAMSGTGVAYAGIAQGARPKLTRSTETCELGARCLCLWR